MLPESFLRFLFFVVIFLSLLVWEIIAPARSIQKSNRWGHNLLLLFINTLLFRVVLPVTAVGTGFYVEEKGWGVLAFMFQEQGIIPLLLGIAILDLALYLQHMVFHQVPILWRFHQIHHSDLDIDITTGGRFHPVTFFLMLLFRIFVIVLFGIPGTTVLAFELLLGGLLLFAHGNISLAPKWERWVRKVFVTPNMHALHHDVEKGKYSCNFGFVFSFWDRLGGTYLSSDTEKADEITFGTPEYKQELTSFKMIVLPLQKIFKKRS